MLRPLSNASTPSSPAPAVVGAGTFAFERTGTGGCATLTVTAANDTAVGSAVIYGRRFADDQLAYKCPK